MAADAGTLVVPPKETNTISYQCPLLTSTNYLSWSIKMESIMDAQGLWDAIEPSEGVVVDLKLIKRARAFLLQSLPENLLLQVAKHKNAKDIWNALKTRYMGADRVQKARIQTLNRELEMLSVKESDSVDEIAGKITEISSKIQSLGSELAESTLVKKLLNSVPEKLLPIVASIEQYSDLESMSFEEAIGRLKTFEERIKPKDQSRQPNQLLLTKQSTRGRGNGRFSRGRGRGRGRFGGRGRTSGNSSEGGKKNDKEEGEKEFNGRRDRRQLRCYNCDKIGHFSAECRAPKREKPELNLAKEDEEPTLLIAMLSSDHVMLNEEHLCPEKLLSKDCVIRMNGSWIMELVTT